MVSGAFTVRTWFVLLWRQGAVLGTLRGYPSIAASNLRTGTRGIHVVRSRLLLVRRGPPSRAPTRCSLLAPERQLKAGWLAQGDQGAVGPAARASAAASTEAGPNGTAVDRAEPGRRTDSVIVLGVLPDAPRRDHNAHVAPPEAIAALTAGAGLPERRAARPSSHVPRGSRARVAGSARAVGRALPTYTRSTREAGDDGRGCAGASWPTWAARPAVKAADQAVVHRARWAAALVDMPPAEMNTSDFVKAARKAARGIPNLKIKVISGDAVKQKGLGGHPRRRPDRDRGAPAAAPAARVRPARTPSAASGSSARA